MIHGGRGLAGCCFCCLSLFVMGVSPRVLSQQAQLTMENPLCACHNSRRSFEF